MKAAKVYPEIECASEKASEQMDFEVTLLKFIRYDRTFFIPRMYPSSQLTIYSFYAPWLRSKISI